MASLRKIKLLISYDGTNFSGWQRQTSVRNIQEKIEGALEKIFSQKVKIYASGRTDAGVHALGQVAHFCCPNAEKVPKDLCHAINCLSPPEIVVKQAWWAPEDFHALYSAVEKTYMYKVYYQERPCPFEENRSLLVRRGLDLDWLNQASQLLVGKKDFASFQSQGSDVATSVREIYEAQWKSCFKRGSWGGEDKKGDSAPFFRAVFKVRGSGFLKHMVRNIVGTLMDLERIQGSLAHFEEILQACDRQKALGTAPSKGLYLKSVTYPPKLDNECLKI